MIAIARPLIGEAEQEAVARVLASGQLANGPEAAAFEKEFAAFVGTRHAVATCNGTAALELALAAMGIGPGDEVIVPAFTFVATANAVLATGATPVFADIDPATFTLDPDDAAAARTPRTKAVLPVHLYGLPADLDTLDLGVPVLEDAAQAHGARLGGRSVGSIGLAACFSFYPTKNMTTGEGGMVTTSDDDLAGLLRSICNQGRGKAELGTYDHVRLGHNMRMTDLHAAIGRVQLQRLPAWNEARRRHAARLANALDGVVGTPHVPPGRTHVFHQFTIRVPDRDGVAARLREAGIGTGIYYPKPLYEYAHLQRFRRPCPASEAAAREVLSLPVHPALTEADVDAVATAVADAVATAGASSP